MKIDKEVLRYILSEILFDINPGGFMSQEDEHKLDDVITKLEWYTEIESRYQELAAERDKMNTEFRQRSDEISNRLHALQLKCSHFSQYIDNTLNDAPFVCKTCGKVFHEDQQ